LGLKNSPILALYQTNQKSLFLKLVCSKMSLRIDLFYLPKNPTCALERESSWLFYKYVAPLEVYRLIRQYFLELLTHTQENLEYYKTHTFPGNLVDYGIPFRYAGPALLRFNSYCRFCGDDLNKLLDIHRYGVVAQTREKDYYYNQPTLSGGGIKISCYSRSSIIRYPLCVRMCNICVRNERQVPFFSDRIYPEATLIRYLNEIQLTACLLADEDQSVSEPLRYYLTYNN
jgi:hypothetical protein